MLSETKNGEKQHHIIFFLFFLHSSENAKWKNEYHLKIFVSSRQEKFIQLKLLRL